MGRSPCCEKAHTNKGAWSKQEDETLIAYIQAHGEGCWRTLPKAAGLQRCGKSCRLRWINYLRPDLKRGNFTPEEDELIIKLHSILGNKWSLIAGKLPGRTDNEIKNYWNTHIKKKMLERGIDPYTHRPVARSASEDSSSNDTCHVKTTSEGFTDFFQQEQATDFFQQEQTTDFFQQHKQVTTASSVDQDVNSSYHGGNKDVNLELSITLPSIGYGGSFTHHSSNGEFGFFHGEGMSSGSKFVSHDSKNSVCCHIGLQCGCCSSS